MLQEILTEEMIETDVECETWQETVKKAGGILVNKGKVKEDFIQKMIDTVMQFGPYVILMPKVAFFHGAPGNDVNELCLSLITLKNEVRFKEFENQPIKCAFAFGAVDSEGHMNMLKEVAMLFQDEEFLKLITENGSKNRILQKICELKEE